MNEELFLKEQNEKFWALSVRFLEGYVIEGSRCLKYMKMKELKLVK